jgi:hypothetical protein
MSTLQDSYEIANSRFTFSNVNQVCQTFVAGDDYTCIEIAIELILIDNTGQGTYNVYVDLKAVDGTHKPTGAALATGSIDSASLTAVAAWYVFDLGAGAALTSGTEYAIVARAADAAGTGYIGWEEDSAGGGPGVEVFSSDSGSTWSGDLGDSLVFRTYSETPPSYVDAAGTFAIALTFSGTGETHAYVNAAGTFAISLALSGTGTIVSGPISGGPGTQTKRRVIAVANNVLYYEDL